MGIYFFTAAISSWLIWLEERIDNKNKNLKRFIIFLAILVPSLVAGMRSNQMGTDVRTYVEPLQYFANSNDNFNSYINYNGTLYNGQLFSRFEKGYVTLIYLCSRLDKGLFLTFFISEFIIVSMTIFGLIKFNKKVHISICLGFFIFLTFFYNLSFNLVRQCIAMFILLYAFNFLIRKEWIKYLIAVVIAMLFHISAIFAGILILLIYYFLYNNEGKTKLKMGDLTIQNEELKIFWIGLVGVIVLLLPSLIKGIFSSSIFSTYLNYIPDSINFSMLQIAIKLPFLIIILLEWNNMKDNPLRYFYLSISIIDILLSQFSGQSSSASASQYGARISWYTSVFYIYSVSSALMADKNKNKRILLTIFLVLFLIAYWYIFTVVLNYNETFPYVFASNLLN